MTKINNRTFSGNLGRVERQVSLWGRGKGKGPPLQRWIESNREIRIPVQWPFADTELLSVYGYFVKVMMNRLK